MDFKNNLNLYGFNVFLFKYILLTNSLFFINNINFKTLFFKFHQFFKLLNKSLEIYKNLN